MKKLQRVYHVGDTIMSENTVLNMVVLSLSLQILLLKKMALRNTMFVI